jgi:hypothetical protein
MHVGAISGLSWAGWLTHGQVCIVQHTHASPLSRLCPLPAATPCAGLLTAASVSCPSRACLVVCAVGVGAAAHILFLASCPL